MAQSSRTEAVVDLFPILNILVCMMGILVFLLGAVCVLAFGVDKSIVIVPGTKSQGATQMEPVYFEWTGTSIIAHPGKETAVLDRNPHEINSWDETYDYFDSALRGSAVEQILNSVAASGGRKYVVVLVRPAGFGNLMDFRRYLQAREYEIGYEPIDQGWKLRQR